jgi:cysteinyl-tRNA synthetase
VSFSHCGGSGRPGVKPALPTLSGLELDLNDFTVCEVCRYSRLGGSRSNTLARVTLRLHDTAVRAVREFQPVTPGNVTVYLCGATVQGAPHLGHLRSAVCFDVMLRWLEASGYRVTYCRNVTDIDDKILRAAATENVPWWALAERNLRDFTRAYELLGCRAPDAEPRATGHIPDMIALVERLLRGGHAYEAGGDLYFDVRRTADYGTLSGQRPGDVRTGDVRPGDMLGGGDIDRRGFKRDPRDFALWRAAKPGEPSWRTPWGPGRPGWHLECSAMATGYLGATFDIHGGGLDLVFPHHENERAQSTAAGDGFARYWVHHGLVFTAGLKMSTSLGNALAFTDALTRARPQELRYYLVQAHYRSTIEYSNDALDEAAAAYQRIERFVRYARHAVGYTAPPPRLPISFAAAMDDDLSVSSALAALHATVRDGNYALNTGDSAGAGNCLAQVLAMLEVLGLDPVAPAWQAGEQGERLHAVVDALVALALAQRDAARARGDYASADSIRDTLEDSGVVVEDTPEGTRWELARWTR